MAKKVFAKSKILNAAIQQKESSEDYIKNNLVVNKELKAFIRSLSDEEFNQLEANILAEGCKDALIVWKNNEEYVLVDGHNRFNICQKHNLPFKIAQKEFADLDAVKDYMLKLQLGRRNLTLEEISYYRGLRYETEKNKTANVFNLKQNITEKDKMSSSVNTAEKIAQEYGVNEKTIKRDAKFSKGLNKLAPEFKEEVLKGKSKVKKQDIQALSTVDVKPNSIKSAALLEKALKSKAENNNKKDDLSKLQKEIVSKLNNAIKQRDKALLKEVKKELTALEKKF
ncbi:ParB N-terminal domain-containing protein [Flexithrix dorotheae]|uniref:ParB N-terminal domain-containing protein n=1 Tax=Flexithrix dorotheae TaxID=70993 RepID=UPI00035D0F71|nr:ParB N-terminal domain-containing protein [Flexithrix dorotheae]